MEKLTATDRQPLKCFHVDGAGARPDGGGSGFAWVRLDKKEELIKRVDGLTNNVAEYRAVIAVLKYVSPGSTVLIQSDSQLVVQQVNGAWAVRDPNLAVHLSRVREFIEKKGLSITLRWIPRGENLAGKLLDRR